MALGNMYWAHNPNSDKHIMFVNMGIGGVDWCIDRIHRFLGKNYREFTEGIYYVLGELYKRDGYIEFSEAIFCKRYDYKSYGLGRGLDKLDNIKYINCFFETELTESYMLFATSHQIKEIENLFNKASKRVTPLTFSDFAHVFTSLKIVTNDQSSINEIEEYLNSTSIRHYSILSNNTYIPSNRYRGRDNNLFPEYSDYLDFREDTEYSIDVNSSLRMDALQELLSVKDLFSLSEDIQSTIETNWLDLKNTYQSDLIEDEEDFEILESQIQSFGPVKTYTSYIELLSHFEEDEPFDKLIAAFPKRKVCLDLDDLSNDDIEEFILKSLADLSSAKSHSEIRKIDKEYLGAIPSSTLPKICNILKENIEITCYNDLTEEEELFPNEEADDTSLSTKSQCYFIKSHCSLVTGDAYEIITKSEDIISPTQIYDIIENTSSSNNIAKGMNCIFNINSILSLTIEDYIEPPANTQLTILCKGLKSPLITLPTDCAPLIYKVK